MADKTLTLQINCARKISFAPTQNRNDFRAPRKPLTRCFGTSEGSHNGIAAVLKTADRKVIRVRIPCPPLYPSAGSTTPLFLRPVTTINQHFSRFFSAVAILTLMAVMFGGCPDPVQPPVSPPKVEDKYFSLDTASSITYNCVSLSRMGSGEIFVESGSEFIAKDSIIAFDSIAGKSCSKISIAYSPAQDLRDTVEFFHSDSLRLFKYTTQPLRGLLGDSAASFVGWLHIAHATDTSWKVMDSVLTNFPTFTIPNVGLFHIDSMRVECKSAKSASGTMFVNDSTVFYDEFILRTNFTSVAAKVNGEPTTLADIQYDITLRVARDIGIVYEQRDPIKIQGPLIGTYLLTKGLRRNAVSFTLKKK